MAAQISPVAVLAPVAPSAPAGVAATSSAAAATNPGAQAFSSELTQAYRPPEKSSTNPTAERPKVKQDADPQSSEATAPAAAEGKGLPTGGEGLPRPVKGSQAANENSEPAASAEINEEIVASEAQAVDGQLAATQHQENVASVAPVSNQIGQSEQLQRQQALLAISQAASETIADSANLPSAVTPVVESTALPAVEAAPIVGGAVTVPSVIAAGDIESLPSSQQTAQIAVAPVQAPTHAVNETLDVVSQKQALANEVAQPSAPFASPSVTSATPSVQDQSLTTEQAATKEIAATVAATATTATATGVTDISAADVDTELVGQVTKTLPTQEQPVAVAQKSSLVQTVATPDALASAVSKTQPKITESTTAVLTASNSINADTSDSAQMRQATLQSFTSPAAASTLAIDPSIQSQQPAVAIPGAMAQPLSAGSLLSEQIAAQTGERAAKSTGVEAESTSARVAASSVESLAQAVQMQSSLRSQAPAQLQMPKGLQPGMAGFNQAVAEKVVIAAGQNIRVANIQLDPPELGALQIRLQVGADQQVSVSFTSPHGNVRDAVEQSIPRLREMLEEQGLSLGESSVNDQSGQGSGDAQEGGDSGQGQYPTSEGEALPEQTTQGSVSLVDYYA